MQIDVLLHEKSQYGVLGHLSVKFAEALSRQGVNCNLLNLSDMDLSQLYRELMMGGADFTLSFNGLAPNEQGEFLCDQIGIPHIAIIVDSANQFADFAKSPRTIITSVDRKGAAFFRGLGGQRVLFLPHGVEQNIDSEVPSNGNPRTFDVTMLSSCIDFEEIQGEWPSRYSKEWIRVLKQAVEGALTQGDDSYVEALTAAVDHHSQMGWVNPNDIDLIQALNDVEMVSRGRERVALLNALEGVKIDLFGSGPWDRYLTNPDVHLHGEIPYNQAYDVMRKSKIVLNSCLWIKEGAHERLFAALSLGAVPVVNTNPYLQKYFRHGEEVLFYQCQKWKELVPAILECLADEEKREAMAAAGGKIVQQNHTWDHRAADLIAFLKKMDKVYGD